MERNTIEKTILNAVTPVAITSSTNATPSVLTVTAHGLTTGDRVLVYGHATNTAVNGIFKAVVVTANTFSLVDEFSGAAINGNGIGGGTGFIMKAPDVILSKSFKCIKFTIITAGTNTSTISISASDGKLQEDVSTPRYDHPNFGATISKTNPYSFIQVVNYDDGSTVNGSTGIGVTGTDINKMYEANTNGLKYVTAFPTAWTQGSITIKAVCFYL